ncbi:MAG: hypothetical protein WAR76_19980, partial [Xanthobacteraceae bacterium]
MPSSLIFYHPAQVKAVTRGTAKPGPNPVYASDTKRISHFLIENCAVRYIPAYYVRFVVLGINDSNDLDCLK